jgi:hypothetical protein
LAGAVSDTLTPPPIDIHAEPSQYWTAEVAVTYVNTPVLGVIPSVAVLSSSVGKTRMDERLDDLLDPRITKLVIADVKNVPTTVSSTLYFLVRSVSSGSIGPKSLPSSGM